MSKGNILVIDDEESIRGVLSQLLSLDDFKVWQADNAQKGIEILKSEEIQVVISDVRLPDAYGIDLISKIKELNPLIEIIMLTAYGTIQDGVTAIKMGAFDYITKGDEDNKIILLAERAMEKVTLKSKLEKLESRIIERYNFDNIQGESFLINEAKTLARKVAATDTPVLLIGETGTGKEIFAQAIHNSSLRSGNHFVAVNCSAIAKDLLESEMFGYKAGAFTGALKNKKGLFEEADNGTLFLDEIGEMDYALQSKLLRVTETNSFIKTGDTKPTTVDVRIIAATNRHLEDDIKNEKFRLDLFYRISTFKIEIPSLKERKEDIPQLAKIFINQFSQKTKKKILNIEEDFYKCLLEYNYPGNIRELRNIIERAVILNEGGILTSDSLPKELREQKVLQTEYDAALSIEQVEKQHIINILEMTKGSKTKAAELLGIGLTTLYRKLQVYNLE
ncbi:MAG: sigma-54 dependent transcriptional regulator [Ignavibacteriales bacterium]|nr:sigma-54 dependent transcriptional regulator [Ignavibacteriales bacterium]